VEEIIDEEKSLNTVSRLVYRIATRNHRALKALWEKPARNLAGIRIFMDSSKAFLVMDSSKAPKLTSTFKLHGFEGIGTKKKVLPTMSPLKDGIIGIGNVTVLFKVNAISEYRSLFEVLFYLLDKLLKY
jgi:hypothetical protein